jgi:hypothetical protein
MSAQYSVEVYTPICLKNRQWMLRRLALSATAPIFHLYLVCQVGEGFFVACPAAGRSRKAVD